MVGRFDEISPVVAKALQDTYPEIKFKASDRLLVPSYGSEYDGDIFLLSEELRLRRKDWDNDFSEQEIKEMISKKELRLLGNVMSPLIWRLSGGQIDEKNMSAEEKDSIFMIGQSMEGYWE